MHMGLCGAKAVGGADVKVDQRNVQRGWKWGFGSACMAPAPEAWDARTD
jgi:hypothetical protein